MRMKLPFLIGALALALAGNAVAGQKDTHFTSFADMSSSGSRNPSEYPSTQAIVFKFGHSGFDKIQVDASAKSNLYGQYRQQDSSQTTNSNVWKGGLSFQDLSGSFKFSHLGIKSGNEFADMSGGDSNKGISERYTGNFERHHDIPEYWDDTATYSNCSIAAVPEPGEWLMMICGLGLVGFIAALRKPDAITG